MNLPRFLSLPVRALSAFGGVHTATSLERDGSISKPALLHLNECPYPPSPRVVEAVSRAVATANRYGDPRPDGLARLITERTGIPPETKRNKRSGTALGLFSWSPLKMPRSHQSLLWARFLQ